MKKTVLRWAKELGARLFISLLVISFAARPAIAQTYASGACTAVPNSKTCVDATPCKQSATGETLCLSTATSVPTAALTIPQTCWQYGYQYACQGQTSANSCTPYETNSACSVVGSICNNTNPSTGQCTGWNYTYNCQTQAAQTMQQMVCTGGVFAATAMVTPTVKNNTFPAVAAATEIMRQAQAYGANGQNIFMGVQESCTQGYFGIKDCCKSSPGAKSNAAIANIVLGAGYSTVKYAGSVAIDTVSPYVFDAMYQVGTWTDNFALQLAGSEGVTNLSASGFSVGAYGFTYGTGTVAGVEGSGLMGGNTLIAGTDGSYVSFNPYVLAAVVAIQYLQALAACSSQEQLLALHRGANLSVFVSQDCSNKIPIIGTCVEYTSQYCSFNSVLAKLINQQGKAQLGIGFAGCSGLTTDQLTQIDFSKLNLTEFTNAVVTKTTASTPTNMPGNYTPVMQQATKGTAQKTTSTLPTYPSSP